MTAVLFPDIMRRGPFEAFVLDLPATTIVRQWRDDSVAKIGGRIFALLDKDPGEVWLKVSDMAYPLLTELDGIRPRPISTGPAGWRSLAKAQSPRRRSRPISLEPTHWWPRG